MTDKLEKIIKHYGYEKQIVKAIEEMSELQKELCKKLLDYENDRDSLIEELADVQIMFKQLQLILWVSDVELNSIMNIKVDRTIKRISQ